MKSDYVTFEPTKHLVFPYKAKHPGTELAVRRVELKPPTP
jgi:hypothetical protein